MARRSSSNAAREGRHSSPHTSPRPRHPCLQPQEGRILDEASPALAEVRAARRHNRAELRAEMDRWARQLHAQGVSERAQVRRPVGGRHGPADVCNAEAVLLACWHRCKDPRLSAVEAGRWRPASALCLHLHLQWAPCPDTQSEGIAVCAKPAPHPHPPGRWWCAATGCASLCGAAGRASCPRAPSPWPPLRAATRSTWSPPRR